VVNYKTAEGSITNTTDSYQGNGEVNITDTVVAGETNMEFDVAFDPATVKSMVLYSDQAVTVKTNSNSSPVDTIALMAKKQRVWNTDHTEIKFLGGVAGTTPITSFHVANAGAVDANLKFFAVLDVTP